MNCVAGNLGLISFQNWVNYSSSWDYTGYMSNNDVKLCLGGSDPEYATPDIRDADVDTIECKFIPWTIDEIREEQRKDPVIGDILEKVHSGKKPKLSDMSPNQRILLNSWNKLRLKDNILYRVTSTSTQLVLPEVYKSLVLRELHDEMGHVSSDKVMALIRPRFYWPYMEKDVEKYTKTQCRCVKQKTPTSQVKEELTSIHTSSPFELLSLDFLELEQSSGGYDHILVLIDHFTRFVVCYPTRNKAGKTAADRLFNDFVLRYGFPDKIHHDQGGEFENELFKQLEKLSGTLKSRTTPYHPQGNGKCERFNRTILGMLTTLEETSKSHWKDHLQKCVHAYNATVSSSTGYSPFFLLYGREPRLPIDALFKQVPAKGERSYRAYVDNWQRSMKNAYEIAASNSEKAAIRNETRYNRRARSAILCEGDRVLIRNVRERGGPGKLRSFWEQKVYRVCERKENSPVYVVEPERGGKRRTIHRNMLFHCGDELPDEPEEVDVVGQKTKEASSRVKATEDRNERYVEDDTSSNSDEEDQDVQRQPTRRVRMKPNRLGYDQLGKPSVNALFITKQTSKYRTWLEQLWILGYWTDALIKQQYTVMRPHT